MVINDIFINDDLLLNLNYEWYAPIFDKDEQNEPLIYYKKHHRSSGSFLNVDFIYREI